MTENKTKSSGLGWLFWAFLWGCVGYFIYGDVNGALALAFFSAVSGLTVILGVIPVIGNIGTFLACNYIQMWLLNYVSMSWAISTIFWMNMIFSGLISLVIVILVATR